MGFQIGGAILDFVVLSILQHSDTYGYEITRQVRQILDVSETALYPALRRLERAGMLEIYDQSFQGRNRRYYRLTEAGEELLTRQKKEWQKFKQDMDRLLEES
ncbi:MAG: PadR family transcriptional regulator [Gemmiger sp.]|uniref:PadR family transcriptional regulator n=1 Tax=Gemmiger sp. TaxID=2049027 RepID=UPI002A9090E8|nr:PadR family transcriptional regulator [Gemmiger sp.]MDY5204440.1 PadR family transcriptional regulator [Gemmiger sp.]